MKRVIAIIFLSVASAHGVGIPATAKAVTRSMPDREARILGQVAEEYGLSSDEWKLLLTIRRIENGRQGLELGVGSNYPKHPARRFARNPDRSLQVQARWAAGTIRQRYTGDIDAFAKIYCPPNWKQWARMAKYWMSQ